MSPSPGKLVVISGPSGAGKTSVVHALKKHPRVEFSVSATTRLPRSGEVDGVDYHFLDSGDFETRKDEGEFLEWAQYNDCYYGTLRSSVDEALANGRLFVLEIEVQGTRQLRQSEVEGEYIFIMPPDIETLRRRLEGRHSDTAQAIERRLEIASEEMLARDMYDHVVVNDSLEEAIAEVEGIIGLTGKG